ncbi:threonine-phosphate decarboxylase CobD [Motiliproteus sediminis]|uniref:threonine-phosphate decarboxylase CobD n=1 Tax=Motiliproteus sediminis TaxID=1468178 RepID=UPI001FE8BD67|nr:threonine-phosphate decarboxylase CobD [Motiliproteus sediminis]
MMLEHGGRLHAAARKYQRPLEQWLDLSTGINPHGWPVAAIPSAVWNRLPEPDDDLTQVAREYYGCRSLLPLAGSQAAIQALPQLRPCGQVALPRIGYQEHLNAWHRAGHRVSLYDQLPDDASGYDVVVVINPNNPSGAHTAASRLLTLHRQLASGGGWLVVDEAFADAAPEQSLAAYSDRPGLLLLRSVGKFFGLAGLRAGFLLAEQPLCARLEQHLGPWAMSHPARWVCIHALQDRHWQNDTRRILVQESRRLTQLLQRLNPQKTAGCALFQTLYHERATQLHQQFADHGVLTRLFNDARLLRLGLPADEAQWQRLTQVVDQLAGTQPTSATTRPNDD